MFLFGLIIGLIIGFPLTTATIYIIRYITYTKYYITQIKALKELHKERETKL